VSEGLGAGMYAAPLLLTLFANFTALDEGGVLRLWDRLLLGGWAEVLSALLAVLGAVAPQLAGAPMEDMLRVLHAPRAYYGGPPSSRRGSGAEAEGAGVDGSTVPERPAARARRGGGCGHVLTAACGPVLAVTPSELAELEVDYLSLPKAAWSEAGR
jgi:hypothetical protein